MKVRVYMKGFEQSMRAGPYTAEIGYGIERVVLEGDDGQTVELPAENYRILKVEATAEPREIGRVTIGFHGFVEFGAAEYP